MECPISLSVIIITLNEAYNLPRCLASLPKGSEVIVVDSFSTDQTIDIARSYGAKVFQRTFDDYASQKNFALQHVSRAWVLWVDADEELDDVLRANIVARASVIPEQGLRVYQLRRRLVFLGKAMRFGKTSDRPLRLFPTRSGQFEGIIHEKFIANRPTCCRTLQGELRHYSYHSLSDYLLRLDRYTSKMALARFKNTPIKKRGPAFYIRPFWEFCSRFILRLGFLDGYAGFSYAMLSSFYAFTKYAKYYEILENEMSEASKEQKITPDPFEPLEPKSFS